MIVTTYPKVWLQMSLPLPRPMAPNSLSYTRYTPLLMKDYQTHRGGESLTRRGVAEKDGAPVSPSRYPPIRSPNQKDP